MKTVTLFEPLFQELRIRKVVEKIPQGKALVDLGCDQPQVLIDRVRENMKSCIGVDIAVTPHKYANVQILRQDLRHKIALPSNSADVVTMLAVLEHVKYPEDIITECFRVLRKNGVLLITVPSPNSKPLLELLAILGLVRKEMIEQHENYFTKMRLESICEHVGFRSVSVESFELGCNTFVHAVK
ncbi:MAG TPA: class I SAM-dependent methyltransferase [Candidatus Saccharimonadia bacterium]|nr:class I SAM-dependent methyltransferase [Candidatus Saccharimonadia bacterium]